MPTAKLESKLDSLTEIAQLDRENMLGSIGLLGEQLDHAWEATRTIEIKPRTPLRQLIIAGMGGSALGADVISSLYPDRLRVPLLTVRDYHLPAWVDASTLVILSSYSGSTEEVLSCAQDAQRLGATVAVITAGGKLAELAQEKKWPLYQLEPQFNPCNQPRQAIGYSVMGLLGLIERAALLSFEASELTSVKEQLQLMNRENGPQVASTENKAKQLAFHLFEKQAVLIGPDFLQGALHVASNQLNENAKTFASYFVVPELNHHLLEALRFPASLSYTQAHLFFHSTLAEARNQKRMRLSETLFAEQELETYPLELGGETKLAQTFELIALMSYCSVYQAILHQLDPSPIPQVDLFKRGMMKA